MVSFPDGFLWGVSTAAHQIEGGNVFSDWYDWEREGKVKNGDISDSACKSWDNFDRDLRTLKDLGVKAYRYSVEWARIEPESGRFEEAALKRYGDFARDLVSNGIQPVLTLNHFTLPRWFVKLGGWEKLENVAHFKNFTRKVVEFLGEYVHYWITLNEPNVYLAMAYLLGEWPPEKKDMKLAARVFVNLLNAHSQSYDTIKEKLPTSMVSVAQNMMPFLPERKWAVQDNFAANFINNLYNHSFLDSLKLGKIVKLPGREKAAPQLKGKLDFLCINYYSRSFVRYARPFPKIHSGTQLEKTDMGYEFYPQGLERVVMDAHLRYQLPIMVSENGIADSTDSKRWSYIEQALLGLRKAMDRGAKVFGYFYWSLMDNFEWREGYAMKFGLYETDRESFELSPRESAMKYKQLIRENS